MQRADSPREEDVSKTMYKETVPAKGTRVTDKEQGSTASATMDFSNKKQAISKVDCICEAFLTVLRSRHTTNLQNIITAHLCKSKPDIESGLSVIADLHEKDPGFVEAAVEHICFLADVNAIYETALGMYNLPLALLVAQQSQKVGLSHEKTTCDGADRNTGPSGIPPIPSGFAGQIITRKAISN